MVIESTNYSQANCKLAAVGGAFYNNSDWNITYTYNYDKDTVHSNASRDSVLALDDISANWMAVIVAVFMAGAIITYLISSGLSKRK